MKKANQRSLLLFIRRLDDLHTLEENKANRLKQPMERRVFPAGKDAKGRSYEDYRWSRFKHFAPAEMFTLVGEYLFPFLRIDLARQLGNGDSTYAHHMKDARFTILQSRFAVLVKRSQQALTELGTSHAGLDALFPSLQHRAFQGEL